MTTKSRASGQERFNAALREKVKDFYSVSEFAKSAGIREEELQDIIDGKAKVEHSTMENLAAASGFDLMDFMEWGQKILDEEAERKAYFDKVFKEREAAAKKKEEASKKVASGEAVEAVIPKPLNEVIEDFSNWAQALVKKDPKMAIWLEKQLQIMKLTTKPFM